MSWCAFNVFVGSVASVTFTVGADGRAGTMNVENLDGEDPNTPLGNFTRG
jgi:hypothetical protein